MSRQFGFKGKWDDWLAVLVILWIVGTALDIIFTPWVNKLMEFAYRDQVVIMVIMLGISAYAIFKYKLRG